MNYQQSLEFLHDLCKFGINLGLERINRLLALLDNPHQQIKTIHVAGTNGKGSTIAILASVLKEAGYKVGVYTSPHLHGYTERIRTNGENISPEDFSGLMVQLQGFLPEVLDQTGECPTEFEVLTAMAFQYFAQEQVDIALIEVGMGGRLDSTNVIKPEIAVITPIGLDHLAYLGPTIIDVAREKAGIIKEQVPVVIGEQEPGVEAVLLDMAKELGAPVISAQEVGIEQLGYNSYGQTVTIKTKERCYPLLTLGLVGDHQLENAKTAIATINTLKELGWHISEEALGEGLKKVRWPGRLEYIASKPPILLDGAHNPQGAQALGQALAKYFKGQELVMVLGILDDKDGQEILEPLVALAKTVIVTRVPDNPRNKHWQRIAQQIDQAQVKVLVEEDVTKAIELAVQGCSTQDLIVITGSLYLLAEARQYVLNHYFPA